MSDPISDVLDMRICDDDAVCVMIKSGNTVQISNNGAGTQLLNMHLTAIIAILEEVDEDCRNESGDFVGREIIQEFINEAVDEALKRRSQKWKSN